MSNTNIELIELRKKAVHYKGKTEVVQVFLSPMDSDNNFTGLVAMDFEDKIDNAEPLAKIFHSEDGNPFCGLNGWSGLLDDGTPYILLTAEAYNALINDEPIGWLILLHELGHGINRDTEDEIMHEVYQEARDEARDAGYVLIEEHIADCLAARFLGKKKTCDAFQVWAATSDPVARKELRRRSAYIRKIAPEGLLNLQKAYSDDYTTVAGVNEWICPTMLIYCSTEDEESNNTEKATEVFECCAQILSKYIDSDEIGFVEENGVFLEFSCEIKCSEFQNLCDDIWSCVNIMKEITDNVSFHGLLVSYNSPFYAHAIICGNGSELRTHFAKYI